MYITFFFFLELQISQEIRNKSVVSKQPKNHSKLVTSKLLQNCCRMCFGVRPEVLLEILSDIQLGFHSHFFRKLSRMLLLISSRVEKWTLNSFNFDL